MTRHNLKIGIFILIIMAFSAEAVLAFSVKQEIQLGKEVSLEVEKEMPLSKNEQWQKDVAEMGARFVPLVKRKEIPYQFHVVDAKDQINAFALPGGNVYFTERMWKIMTPDERAAVMAHEITHCDQRHAIDGMIKSNQRALWSLPLMVLGGGWGYAVAIGNTMINQRYSRKMEREADEMGIQLCKQAGYNPAGSVTSMKKLLSIESGENRYEISELFADHPDTLKRITYLSQEAIALGANLSELELKAVDDPARLGNVFKTSSDMGILYARVSTPLQYGQKVLIKKMLWDDDLHALAPKTIATATVLTPGRLPTLVVDRADNTNFSDIMEGDGVFPIPAPATDSITPPTLKEPAKS